MERHDSTRYPTDRDIRRARGGARFDDAWRDDRAYLLDRATRMLGNATEAEDVIQDAFVRLARVEIDRDRRRARLARGRRPPALSRPHRFRASRGASRRSGTTMPDGSVLLRGGGTRRGRWWILPTG